MATLPINISTGSSLGIPRTIAIALIAGMFTQEFTSFCHHHASRHDFHQIMKTIFFPLHAYE